MDESKGQAGGVLTPVAQMVALDDGLGTVILDFIGPRPPAGTFLFTRPTPAAAADLTDERIQQIAASIPVDPAGKGDEWFPVFARAIEAELVAASPAAAAGVPTDKDLLRAFKTPDVALTLIGMLRDEVIVGDFQRAVIAGCRAVLAEFSSPVAPAGAPPDHLPPDLKATRELLMFYRQGWGEVAGFQYALSHLDHAMALLSAGSQAEGAHQDASVNEAAPQTSVASPAPLPSPRATGRSELPREPS